MVYLARLWFMILTSLTSALVASALLVNHTIDDQSALYPNLFTHIPADGSWSAGQECTSCSIHPGIIDPTQAYNGTWTYTAYVPGNTKIIQATFNGTAVYVYNILANRVPDAATFMNLSFSIDNVYRGEFIHIPDSSTTVLYDVSVFAADNLTNTLHTLSMTVQGQNASHVMFDYLVYTTEEPDPPSSNATSTTQSGSIHTSSPANESSSPHSSSLPVSAIVGGVIGGIATIVIAGALLWLLYRCRRRRQTSSMASYSSKTPYMDTAPGFSDSSREPRGWRGGEVPVSLAPEPFPLWQHRHTPSNTTAPHSSPLPSIPPRDEASTTQQDSDRYLYSPQKSAMPVLTESSQDIASRDGGVSPPERPGVQSDAIRAQVAEFLQEELERLARVREAERLRLVQEPPPNYEEPASVRPQRRTAEPVKN
ncbi:hypothetical protein GY45DRAFT_136827 [Cubamyces sp. BRFM 1775]|nr:hypothetical protein GY45DRAFT_136827 [Cubamyces sp. BRFM 1775]